LTKPSTKKHQNQRGQGNVGNRTWPNTLRGFQVGGKDQKPKSMRSEREVTCSKKKKGRLKKG